MPAFWMIDRFRTDEVTIRIDNDINVPEDEEGSLLYQAACEAIYQARKNGSEKHSPDSWREETIENQLSHAYHHISDHLYTEWTSNAEDSGEEFIEFDLEEAEHALCRLAIAIALYKLEQKSE